MTRYFANQLIRKNGLDGFNNYRRMSGFGVPYLTLIYPLNGNIWIRYRNFSEQPSNLSEKVKNQKLSASASVVSTVPKIRELVRQTKQLSMKTTEHIGIKGKSLIAQQWNAFWNWYDEFSHTNEVRMAHKQIEELQEKLNEAQQLRRDVSKELHDIRYELQMCFADQINCQKGDPRYLELIRREIEISTKDKQKNEEFQMLDKAERDLFILLQAAVKTSHEKEKIHTNSAKYWSIVGSLAGALLGICGTAFSFYNRNDLLSDINKEFIVIRDDTKSISKQIQQLASEQREFLQTQRERESLMIIEKQQSMKQSSNDESWLHWIGRRTYVIACYRYFVPASSI